MEKKEIIVEISFFFRHWNEYEVQSRYDSDLIKIFKSIIGRRYNAESKSWIFPVSSYHHLCKRISEHSNFKIEKTLTSEELKSLTAVYDIDH